MDVQEGGTVIGEQFLQGLGEVFTPLDGPVADAVGGGDEE